MGKIILNGILFFLLLLSCIACQRPMYTEEDEAVDDGTRIPLKVSARSESDTKVDYPAYIYVFDAKNGSYVDYCTITDKDDETLDLELLPGEYTVVAIAGVGEDYDVPTEPKVTDVIRMKAGNRSTQALMMGRSSVTVRSNTQTSLNVTLYYAVSSVEISLSGIPSSTDEVIFSLSPLYSGIGFNGEYTEGGKNTEVDCTQGNDGLWQSGLFYIYPGSGSQTPFSITLKNGNSEQTYAYTFKGRPEAKVPLIIKGSYKGDISISGTLVAGGWEKPQEVSFDFGPQVGNDDDNGLDNNGGDEGNGNDNNQSGLTKLPKVGDFWEGGIVASIENVANGYNILLMSVGEWETKAADVGKLLEEIEKDDWEIPLIDDARILNKEFGGDNLSTINEKITAIGENNPLLKKDRRYLCYDEFGDLKAFGFKDTPNINDPGATVTYSVRLVQLVNFEIVSE